MVQKGGMESKWDIYHAETGSAVSLQLTDRGNHLPRFYDINHFAREVCLKLTSLIVVVWTTIFAAGLTIILADSVRSAINIPSEISALPLFFAFYLVIFSFTALAVYLWKLSRMLKSKVGQHWELNSPPHNLSDSLKNDFMGIIMVCLSSIFTHSHQPPQPTKRGPKYIVGLAQAWIGVVLFLVVLFVSVSLLDSEVIPAQEIAWGESNISFLSVVASVIIGNIAGLFVLAIASASPNPTDFILFACILGITSVYVAPAANNLTLYVESWCREKSLNWYNNGVLKPVAFVYSILLIGIDLFFLFLLFRVISTNL